MSLSSGVRMTSCFGKQRSTRWESSEPPRSTRRNGRAASYKIWRRPRCSAKRGRCSSPTRARSPRMRSPSSPPTSRFTRSRRHAGRLLPGRRAGQGPCRLGQAGQGRRHDQAGRDPAEGARALGRRTAPIGSASTWGCRAHEPWSRRSAKNPDSSPPRVQQLADGVPRAEDHAAGGGPAVPRAGEQRSWDLCDKAFSKDLAGAIRSLRSIEEGGDDALKTLGAIASRLRDLIKVRALPQRTPPKQAASSRRAPVRVAGSPLSATGPELLHGAAVDVLHERVTEADRALKSGATGDIVMPVLITADRRVAALADAIRAATALAALVRRLLRRAAVFLWTMPLLAALSKAREASRASACAVSASPSATAECAFLVEVFSEVRTALFRS